jgi:hypothetical protein
VDSLFIHWLSTTMQQACLVILETKWPIYWWIINLLESKSSQKTILHVLYFQVFEIKQKVYQRPENINRSIFPVEKFKNTCFSNLDWNYFHEIGNVLTKKMSTDTCMFYQRIRKLWLFNWIFWTTTTTNLVWKGVLKALFQKCFNLILCISYEMS